MQLNVYAQCIYLSGGGIMTFELLFFFFPKKKEETYMLNYVYLAIGGDRTHFLSCRPRLKPSLFDG